MGLLQLPDLEESDLIDPTEFKVRDDPAGTELDLTVPVCDQPFFPRCREPGQRPVLHLCSRLFRDAEEVARDSRVERVLHKGGTR